MKPLIITKDGLVIGLATFDGQMTPETVANFKIVLERHMSAGGSFKEFPFNEHPFVRHFHVSDGTAEVFQA